MFDLALEEQLLEIPHALRIEDAFEVVAFMRDDPGVEALGGANDALSVGVVAGVADMARAIDPAAQPRYREAAFPAALRGRVDDLDHWVDEHRQRRGVVVLFRVGEVVLAALA